MRIDSKTAWHFLFPANSRLRWLCINSLTRYPSRSALNSGVRSLSAKLYCCLHCRLTIVQVNLHNWEHFIEIHPQICELFSQTLTQIQTGTHTQRQIVRECVSEWVSEWDERERERERERASAVGRRQWIFIAHVTRNARQISHDVRMKYTRWSVTRWNKFQAKAGEERSYLSALTVPRCSRPNGGTVGIGRRCLCRICSDTVVILH